MREIKGEERNDQYIYRLMTIRLSVIVWGIHLCGGAEDIPMCVEAITMMLCIHV
jgi:hypothetical protein